MHKETKVCDVYENSVVVYKEQLMPFELRGELVTTTLFNKWLNSRLDHLFRTYMNKVYIARIIGRDRERILRDSFRVTPAYNFNNAFMEYEHKLYYNWVINDLKGFLSRHKDVHEKLSGGRFKGMVKRLEYLTEGQKTSILSRVDWLLK